MALDLSAIAFRVDTTELDRAGKAIGELVTNVGKLDKSARTAAQTEATLARAAKDSAKANLDNAKAQDTRLKSTITADKADQQAAVAIERKTKATERASTAIKKNADMLQLQNDTYDFILEGFSKGDAKVLAMAKATGQLSDHLKQVLTDIRQFSKNTFDQTETGLDRMVKSAKEASSAQGFLNNGLNLTSKQAKELSNDLDRLNIRLQHQGKSYQEITKEQAIYKQRFVEEASAVNRATSALAAVEKQRKDVVSATNYLTQADQKMAAALSTSNMALDKAGTDSLVKYETALRKSGASQDVATLKLAKYKAQLEQVQIQEQKRREQHLTRALAPQATDVVVSLWSGQNPLTVLLQQGGQVTDLFMQSGIAAEKFGEVVKSSMKSMLPSILTVVKGVGGLLVDGFVAAGNAVSGFLAKTVGMTGAMDKMYMKMSENGPSQFGGTIRNISALLSGVFATGVFAVVASLIALGVAFKNAIKEGAELTRNLELTGASLALTKSAALDLAQSLASSERPVANVVSVITELAKAGKFSSDNIALVTNAAIDLERYGKVSIAETAKELTKLRDDPVKALIEVAEKTGYVDAQTIETVKSLREQGRMADAATVAMTAWADSSTRAATGIKNQMSPLEQVWDSMLSKINKVIGRLQDLARGSGLAEQIADKEAQLASVKGGFFTSTFGLSPKGAKDVNRLTEEIYLLKLQLQAETDITNERKRRSSAAAQMKAEEDAVKGYTDALDKQAKKELSLSEFVKKAVENRTKAIAAALGKNVEDVKVTAETIAKISKGAEAEWKAAQSKPKKDPADNYYATLMREATAASIKADDATKSLTKSQVQLLEAVNDPRFLGLSKAQQENYLNTMAANVAKEQQIALTEEQGKAEDRLLRILGKSQGIGRQYYADMENMLQDAALLGKSREEIEELTRALFKATPAWKAYEKALEEVNSAARKFNEDSLASQAATLKENESLDYRLSLLGKTTEEQRALSIEYNRANKLGEVRIKLAKQLRDIKADIEKAEKKGLPESDYQSLIDAQVQARKDAAEQEKVINREVAVQYAEDFQKEFDAIKNGISDSIVTALFEGGKAGSKKFRDLVVAQLRKPVTMVVNAVVNTLLGSLTGGAAASAAGGAAGDALSSAGGSILGSAIGGVSALGIGASYGASSLFANGLSATLSAGSSMIGAGSVMSGIGTIAGALGPISLGLSAVMTLAKKFDTSGTPHIGAGAIYSSSGGLREGQGIYGAANFGMGIASEYTKGTQESVSIIAKTLGQTFDGIAKSFGKTAGYEISTAFADDSSKDGSWGSLIIKRMNDTLVNWQDTQTSRWAPKEFANAEEGYKQYIAQIAKDARQVILDMNLAGWANDILMAIGDSPSVESLAAAVQQIAKVQSVFESFGQYMSVFANMADSAKTTLINASGGIDALTSNMSTFVDKFYTDAEKLAINSNNLSEELSKLGFEMPKTREEFKALVQSQIELGDSGAVSVAALLSLSGAMDAVLPAFTAVEDAVNSLSDVMKNLLGERKKLEAELLRAKGDQEGYAAALRAIATEGYTAAEIAAYDYNQALKSQVDALDAASKAAQDAAKAAQDAALNNVDNAFAALQKAVDAQKTIVQTSIDRLKSIFSILQTNIKELYNEVNSTFSMQASSGRSFIDEALAAAQSTGALPDPEKLSEALSAVRKGVDNNTYTSQFEADKDRLVLAGKLSVLSGISEDQLSNAELQLRSLNDILANAKLQVDAIKGVDNSVMSVEQAIANLANALSIAKGLGAGAGGIISDIPGSNSVYTGSALVKVPAEQYKGYTKDQISGRNNWTFGSSDAIEKAWQGGDYATVQDIVNRAGLSQVGIKNTFRLTNEELAYVNSLGIQGVDPTKALAGYEIMLEGGVSTNTGQPALFDALAQQAQAALAAGNEMSIYQSAVDRGLNSADINSLLGLPAGAAENWAKENGLPVLRTGTNLVPQDGLAFLHKDEAVIPKAFNPWSEGGSTGESTAAEVRALREENKAQALAMVQLQARLTKIIERWDGNGLPETRTV